MSLSIVKDISRYTHANHQGEIQFSKLGLIPKPSSSSIHIDTGTLVQEYDVNSFLEWRFSCSKFDYTIQFVDVADDWSQDPTQSIVNKGRFQIYHAGGQFIFNIEDFIALLQSSILGQYYTIEYSILAIPNQEFILKLVAKEASLNFDIDLYWRDTPSGGFVNYGMASYKRDIVNFTDQSTYFNYQLNIRVLVEDDTQKDILHEVYTKSHTTGEIDNLRTLFTFREIPFILRQYLSLSAIKNPFRILIDKDVLKKFKVEYWESWETELSGGNQATTPVRSFQIANKYALASGYDELKSHLGTEPLVTLNNVSARHHIAPGQPAWFSFLITEEILYPDLETIYFKVETNLGEVIKGDLDFHYIQHSNIFHIPVHFGVDSLENVDWIKCTVALYGNLNPNYYEFTTSQTYYIDKKHYAIDRWFYYLNSLGGIDSIRLFGDTEDSMICNFADYESIQNSDDISGQGFMSRQNSSSLFRSKGLSGWLDRTVAEQFKDFILSKFVFEIDKTILPTALAVGEIIPSDLFLLSLRHCMEQLQSHKVSIISKDLTLPKRSDHLIAFKVDIERAYSDIGYLNQAQYTALPALYEDELEFTIIYPTIHKAPIVLNISGDMALPEVYINGLLTPATTPSALPISREYGAKNLNYSYIPRDTAVYIRIRGHYTRHLNLFLTDTSETSFVQIHKAKFFEIRSFKVLSSPARYISGADILWLNCWRTLADLRLHRLNLEEALNLILAIHNHYNHSTPYNYSSWFNNVNLRAVSSGAGFTPTWTMNSVIASLNTKGITVTL